MYRHQIKPQVSLLPVLLDERPRRTLRQRFARAVHVERRGVAPLLADLLHRAVVPVALAVHGDAGVAGGLRGENRRGGRGEDDASDGGRVVLRAGEEADGAGDGGADDRVGVGGGEGAFGGEVDDRVDASDGLIEGVVLRDGGQLVGNWQESARAEREDISRWPYLLRPRTQGCRRTPRMPSSVVHFFAAI